MMGSNTIEIKNLCKSYEKNGSIINALDDVNLSFPDKGLVIISGKNGSGKTTLLNMLGLIDEPERGSIFYRGQDILKLRGKDRDIFRACSISYIFQKVNLINSLTAKENLLLINDDVKEVTDALSLAAIAECADKFPNQMSQGQIQKVAIARAMMSRTSILLADEPTSALDVGMKHSVVAQLRKAAEDKLVIVVTHDIDLNWEEDMKINIEDGRASVESIKNKFNNEQDIDKNEQDCKEKDKDVKEKFILADKEKSLSIKPKLAVKFGLRSIKKSKIGSVVFAIFSLIIYAAFTLLLGCPNNDFNNILTKLYDENGNNYVIAQCYDEPRDAVQFSKFSNITLAGCDIDENTPLWYAAVGYKPIGHSGIVNQDLLNGEKLAAGRLAKDSNEIVISDYLADCIITLGLWGNKYSDYDAVLSDGFITLEYNSLQVQLKVVGIAKTDAGEYKHLKLNNSKSLSISMRQWKDGLIIPQNKLDAEFAMFLYKYVYSYCLCYCDDSLDGEIVRLSKHMQIDSELTLGDYIYNCSAVYKADCLLPQNKYDVGDGIAIVSLSALIQADEFYKLISEGITNGKTSSQVISEYVNSLPDATVNIYGNNYAVGAYYDDFAGGESGIYFPEYIAEKFFEKYLSESTSGTYAIKATGKDVAELSSAYSIFFPEYEIAIQSSGMYDLIFRIVMIACIALLILSGIFIISDITMYCISNEKQIAIIRCLGISNSSATIAVFMKYLIIMAVSYVLSFALSLPLIFTLSDIITSPYKSIGFITFSPWSVLLSVAYTGVIFIIAYVFGLNKIKKPALGALLRK